MWWNPAKFSLNIFSDPTNVFATWILTCNRSVYSNQIKNSVKEAAEEMCSK